MKFSLLNSPDNVPDGTVANSVDLRYCGQGGHQPPASEIPVVSTILKELLTAFSRSICLKDL